MTRFPASVAVYTTCPPSNAPALAYREVVTNVSRWSDAAGCVGMLVYTDNGLVDPWLVAEHVLNVTDHLAPLVAVQPAYMHPYAAAKMVASLGFLHGRAVHLNMVAGGFVNDLVALGDATPHDRRYDRLVEYTTLMQALLAADRSVTHAGSFYQVTNLRMTPALPPSLQPTVLVSGSSAAGIAAATALGAVVVHYPKPPDEYTGHSQALSRQRGIRIGILARADRDEAWREAERRFPSDRKGQLTHQLAMKVSDSAWHQQLSELAAVPVARNPYWLVPFENYKTFCPYLVGSYDDVAMVVGHYLHAGFGTYILDVPQDEADLVHAVEVFERACMRTTVP
jgi:alkanesulfonate monooxygenase